MTWRGKEGSKHNTGRVGGPLEYKMIAVNTQKFCSATGTMFLNKNVARTQICLKHERKKSRYSTQVHLKLSCTFTNYENRFPLIHSLPPSNITIHLLTFKFHLAQTSDVTFP